MAEFSKVSREYIRMCESFFETCEGCPISACSGNVCRDRVLKNPEKYEDTIMKWAAEHPVYPTWGDYITGLVIQDICDGKTSGPETVLIYAMNTPIPADIAQKLGLQPKE